MTLSNHVRHWMGRVVVSSFLDGEIATMVVLVWPQTLPCFFLGRLYFELCPIKICFFLVGNEYSGVKKLNSFPN